MFLEGALGMLGKREKREKRENGKKSGDVTMIHTDDIKARLDCRQVVERELGAPHGKSGKNSRWACPFHGGKDANFSVTETGYKCFSVCGASGDAIRFIMDYRGLDFRGAIEYLGGDSSLGSAIKITPRPQAEPARPSTEAMNDIAARAKAKLWGPDGGEGLDYLRARGLQDEIIEAAGLGFIPNHRQTYKVHGLTVFAGITIPSTYRGGVEFIQFRNIWNNEKENRYRALGNAKGTLFGGDSLEPFQDVYLFEGAFDSLIARQLGFQAAALSGAKNELSPRWYYKILTAQAVYLCGDDDLAGRGFQERHRQLLPTAIPWVPPPTDLNSYYLDKGPESAYVVMLRAVVYA